MNCALLWGVRPAGTCVNVRGGCVCARVRAPPPVPLREAGPLPPFRSSCLNPVPPSLPCHCSAVPAVHNLLNRCLHWAPLTGAAGGTSSTWRPGTRGSCRQPTQQPFPASDARAHLREIPPEARLREIPPAAGNPPEGPLMEISPEAEIFSEGPLMEIPPEVEIHPEGPLMEIPPEAEIPPEGT